MSQDHYVWIGPTRSVHHREGPQVLLKDQALVFVPGWMHAEPIRGSAYTLAIFGQDAWTKYVKGGEKPSTIGYCTAHSLGYSDVRTWMYATGYKWEGP